MSAVATVAVVGHSNAGKTSLMRTLTRRRDFGEISVHPATTRHVELAELAVAGQPVLLGPDAFVLFPTRTDSSGTFLNQTATTEMIPITLVMSSPSFAASAKPSQNEATLAKAM